MTQEDYIRIKQQLSTLKEVAEQYGGRTIDNVIMQLEARVKHHENIHKTL